MSLLKGNEMCHHQHWKTVSVLVNFQDKVYSITTGFYTKYSTQGSYLGMENVSYSGSGWSSDVGMKIYRVAEKSSEDVRGRMERVIHTGRGPEVWMSQGALSMGQDGYDQIRM